MTASATLDESLLLITAGEDPDTLTCAFRDLVLDQVFLHDDAQAALLTCSAGHGWMSTADGVQQLARITQLEVSSNLADVDAEQWHRRSRQLQHWQAHATALTLLHTRRAAHLTDGTTTVTLPPVQP